METISDAARGIRNDRQWCEMPEGRNGERPSRPILARHGAATNVGQAQHARSMRKPEPVLREERQARKQQGNAFQGRAYIARIA